MAQEPVIQIWSGTSSFAPGLTPFGYYDADVNFQHDADLIAKWAARRLGYPISDVELIDINFYAAFEQATSEFSFLINSYNARDILLNVAGQSSENISLESSYVVPSLQGILKIAKQYATEVGAGGNLKYYTGSIDLIPEQQIYDLDEIPVNMETGSIGYDNITIRRIFHEGAPNLNYHASMDTMSYSNQYALESFNWQNSVPSYTLIPINYDLIRIQALEFNQMIRQSSHSFELTGNRLRIFPIPTVNKKLFFTYTLNDELLDGNINTNSNGSTVNSSVISDYSNIPYNNIQYSRINDMGKHWIKRYSLAICKEMLGLIRGKYSSIPIPDNEIQLNASDLLSQAQTEQENLISELKELLESMSKQSQLERKQAESAAISEQINKIPLPIYVK